MDASFEARLLQVHVRFDESDCHEKRLAAFRVLNIIAKGDQGYVGDPMLNEHSVAVDRTVSGEAVTVLIEAACK